jgi:multiple sugar transport system substrate-binding protein
MSSDTRSVGTRRLLAAALSASVSLPLVASAVSAQDESFDIGRYADAGCTVDILLVDGERDQNGLLDREAELEAATGIDINVTALALGNEVEAVGQAIRADESPFDIVDVLGFFIAGSVGTGLFEPLNDYVADPAKTPADYDLADFPPGVLEYQGYFDVENGAFGGDDLYLIPGIHSGSAILFYRQDLLDAAGLEVPTTWAEYLATAEALTDGDVAGSAMVAASGDVTAFLVDWYTRFITMGGEMTSGSKDDGSLRINLDGPEAAAALQNMVDLVPFSPVGVTGFGFTEATDQFAIGKVAMFPTWSTIAGSLYGPDSLVSDTVAVAPMPADDGNPRSIRGGWGLGIPANLPQEAKDCAWHVLTQITSKDFEKHQVLNYQTDPNRSSTADDAEIVEALPYIPEAVAALESAQFLEFVDLPETFEIAGEIAREINLALTGTKSAEQAMADAQTAVDAILQREGYQAAS